jgi:hypothetical protein
MNCGLNSVNCFFVFISSSSPAFFLVVVVAGANRSCPRRHLLLSIFSFGATARTGDIRSQSHNAQSIVSLCLFLSLSLSPACQNLINRPHDRRFALLLDVWHCLLFVSSSSCAGCHYAVLVPPSSPISLSNSSIFWTFRKSPVLTSFRPST